LGSKDSNVVLELFEELFKIDERVLYFDTDSGVFISIEKRFMSLNWMIF
jgi:hypothetical protein